MSRIGRKPIVIPAGVEVTIKDNVVTVKGPKGTLNSKIHPMMIVKIEGGEVLVTRPNDEKEARSLHGLTRTNISNMVEGVVNGFEKKLEVQGLGLFVGFGGGHKSDVHTAHGVDLVVVDLGEDQLLFDAQGVVAAAIEGVAVDSAEVAHAGQGHAEQPVHELVHALAAQGDLHAHGHALAQLEVRHALFGLAHDGLLAGDLGNVAQNGLDHFLVVLGFAAAHVHDNLIELGDLHNALVAKLAHEGGSNLADILFFQTCHCVVSLLHSSAPHLRHTRTFLPSFTVWATRVALPHLGQTGITLQA